MDLLNLTNDERLDIGDLQYALNTAPPGLVNELTGNFFVSPGAFSVVTGFRPSASASQGPVQVGDTGTPNVAFLGQRIGSAITQGVFTMQGPATQQVSIATFPAGTYGIFVRFNRLPGTTQTRKFWSKSAPGSEYAQLAETRLVATWETRIELTAPSAEWQQIGQAVVTSAGSGQGSTVVVTDQRSLYFEGPVASAFAPVWGTAADRATDRIASNTGNLQRQLDALRACIVDIKGRGLAKWYQPNISGMQIGSGFGLSDQPSINTLAIGDTSYSFSNTNGAIQQSLNGLSDYIFYLRSNQFYQRVVGGVSTWLNQASGATRFGGGTSYGFVSANATGSQYALAAVNISNAAYLGVLAPTAKDAFIDFGTSFNQPRMQIRTTWTGTLATNFYLWDSSGSNVKTFLTATYDGATSTTSVGGDTITIGGKPYVRGAQPWAAGFYGGSGLVTAFYGVTGTPTVGFTGNNGVQIIFPTSVPAGSIFSVTPIYNSGANKMYVASIAVNNNTLTVYMIGISSAGQNDGATSIQPFCFTVTQGG